MHLKRGDSVQIIAGRDRPRRPEERRRPSGKVLRVHPKKGLVEVEGKNLVWKHLRKSEKYPRGARLQREAPLDASNVMLFCPACEGPRRVRVEVTPVAAPEPGKPKHTRARLCKKCGHRFDQ